MTAMNDKLPQKVTAKDESSSHRGKEGQPDRVPAFTANDTGWKYIGKPAPPPPESLDAATELPLAKANLLSKLTFWWLSPLLRLGFKRPLADTDLWNMDESRQSTHLTHKLEASIARRKLRAAQWNTDLDNGCAKPRLYRRLRWSIRACWPLPENMEPYGGNTSFGQRRATLEAEWRAVSGRRVASLAWALSDAFPQFWFIGLFKVGFDTATVVSPLLIRTIIEYNQQANQNNDSGPSLGRGVALSFGTLLLGLFTAVCLAQFQFQGRQIGALMRAALIGAIYRKASGLSPHAQANFSSGTLMTFLSSDTTRIHQAVGFLHGLWTSPLQCIAILVLVCIQIGSAGLLGFLLFILLLPVQIWVMKFGIRIRNAAIVWTEARTKLLQELLSSMGITKMFTYEIPYLAKLDGMRRKETAGIRILLFTRAASFALSNSLPTFGAVVAFIAYSAFHPSMNPAVVFTALAYFNALRGPLQFLPRAVSLSGDALTALHRLSVFFEAPDREYEVVIDPNLGVAISVIDASFEWGGVSKPSEEPQTPVVVQSKSVNAEPLPHAQPRGHADPVLQEPFRIRNLSFRVPIGKLVAIIGPVGSGKSSILSGLLGDMPLTHGNVTFGGKVGYCQQSAWIQNATIRNNILFGEAWNEPHYSQCIKQAGLVRDLELFPNGDNTEIGERGVNLSGGQKQRISLARALYSDPDIYLLDDPLSAVDARVGRAMFNDAILALRNAGKTVVLVTHGLHMLPEVDYIYNISKGAIVEQGSYAALMEDGGPFRQLMDEFGGTHSESQLGDGPRLHGVEVAKPDNVLAEVEEDSADGLPKEDTKEKVEATLVEAEERKTGSLGAAVYAHYLTAGNPLWLLPVALCAILYQGSQLMSTVWLTYWAEDKFHETGSFYQGLYATLGVLSGIFCFFMGMCFIVMCINICKKLYSRAARRVFFSPMRFFETQPTGRLMGIFGKDFEVLDNSIPDVLIQSLLAVSMFIGAVVIITIHLPFFIAIVVAVGLVYSAIAYYYRRTSRELIRLSSNLRSILYSHFSETLAGMPTIRAYGKVGRSIEENTYRIDLENRANILAGADQSWLELRLDAVAQLLSFSVTLACTIGASKLSSGQVGLSLNYLNQTTNSLAALVVVVTEAPYKIKDVAPDTWPSLGAIELHNVVMSYRPSLPPVLKGITLKIEPGERVGIVGRTGAGKTSITVAMYRLVEITSGAILIDGVNIATLGLQTLRSAISIIPQDPVLFSGTLRTNLDPFNVYDDETLNHALRRAHLNEEETREDSAERLSQKFTLDMAIDAGGSNLSLGQRSLVSLARALAKNARILILDEATASVDLETDSLIQEAIRGEAQQGRTLLCIAHRLRTIIGWDKVLVMDAGHARAFGTPLDLFDTDSVFKSMCEGSNISREEIVRAAREERIAGQYPEPLEP